MGRTRGDFQPESLFGTKEAMKAYCGKNGCYALNDWQHFQKGNAEIDSWFASPISCSSVGYDMYELKGCIPTFLENGTGTGVNQDLVTVGVVTTQHPSCNIRACASLNGDAVETYKAGDATASDLICGDVRSQCATKQSMGDESQGWVHSDTVQNAVACPVGYYAKNKYDEQGANAAVQCGRITDKGTEPFGHGEIKGEEVNGGYCANTDTLRAENKYFETMNGLKDSKTVKQCLEKCKSNRGCAGCSVVEVWEGGVKEGKFYQMIPWKTDASGYFQLDGDAPVPDCDVKFGYAGTSGADDVQFYTEPAQRKCTLDSDGSTCKHPSVGTSSAYYKSIFPAAETPPDDGN